MKFKRLLMTGLLALLSASAAMATTSLETVQVSANDQAATVSLHTTGSFAHKEYSPTVHLWVVDLAGVSVADTVARSATVSSPLLHGYKVSTFATDGVPHTRLELQLGEGVTPTLHDAASGMEIVLASVQTPHASAGVDSAAPPLQPAGAVAAIRRVTVLHNADGIDVLIEGPKDARAFLLQRPERLVVDFDNTVVQTSHRNIAVGSEGVVAVRLGRFQARPPVARLVVDLKGPHSYDVLPAGNEVTIKIRRVLPASAKTKNDASAVSAALPREEVPSATGSPALLAVAQGAPEVKTAPARGPQSRHDALLPPALRNGNNSNGEAASTPKYTGEPISVNLKDIDLKDFFRLIHEISGLNVVLDPSVHGSVTLVLDDVPWDQALDIVLKNNGLDRELQGKVLRIAATETLRKEAVERRAQAEAVALAVDRQTITRLLSYAKAKDAVPIVKKFLTARGDIIADERTNALIISDIPSVIPSLDKIITQLDRKSQEVEIEVRVVSATRSFSRDVGFQVGVNWSNGASSLTGVSALTTSSTSSSSSSSTSSSTSTTSTTNTNPGTIPLFSNFPATSATTGLMFTNVAGLDVVLTAAEGHNLAKVLSRPRVVTQSNQKAEVKQGVKLPVYTASTSNTNSSVTYIDSVLRLSVTPQITADGTIFMTVDVENTQPSGLLNDNYILTTQQATTQVLVTDGGTVAIGGVIMTSNSVSTKQTPWLGDIPLLGNLFKSKSTSTETDELIFFITPKIIQT